MTPLPSPEEIVISLKPGLISSLGMREAIYKDRSLIIARLEEYRKAFAILENEILEGNMSSIEALHQAKEWNIELQKELRGSK